MPSADLDEYLSRQQRLSRSTAKWGGGIELEITGYLGSESPPTDLVSSVRAIVFKDDQVLVIENVDGAGILPGGRVEEGETLMETLRRELLEEAGVEIAILTQVGLIHLRHLTAKPENHPYPYPDFLWPTYAASAVSERPVFKVEDDYAVASLFMPVERVRQLELEEFEYSFLEAAVEVVDPSGSLGSS